MRRFETHVGELRSAAASSDNETDQAIYLVGAAICERLEQLIETAIDGGAVWSEVEEIKGMVVHILRELRSSR